MQCLCYIHCYWLRSTTPLKGYNYFGTNYFFGIETQDTESFSKLNPENLCTELETQGLAAILRNVMAFLYKRGHAVIILSTYFIHLIQLDPNLTELENLLNNVYVVFVAHYLKFKTFSSIFTE